MLYALRSCGRPEALPHSNLVFQLRAHSLGISGFELDPYYCQLPVAEEVQPDRNSCPFVLTVVWIVLDSNYARQTSESIHCISSIPSRMSRATRVVSLQAAQLEQALAI